jgi:rhodanese-related sulfurtransferase
MKRLPLLILLFAGTLLSAQVVKNLGAEEFKKLIGSKNTVLIDLRTNDEISNKGMIKGAAQIDWLGKNAEQEISKMDKTKTYLVYCAGGGRSSEAAEFMQKSGFKNVYNLEKGFDDWKKKGFEILLK